MGWAGLGWCRAVPNYQKLQPVHCTCTECRSDEMHIASGSVLIALAVGLVEGQLLVHGSIVAGNPIQKLSLGPCHRQRMLATNWPKFDTSPLMKFAFGHGFNSCVINIIQTLIPGPHNSHWWIACVHPCVRVCACALVACMHLPRTSRAVPRQNKGGSVLRNSPGWMGCWYCGPVQIELRCLSVSENISQYTL